MDKVANESNEDYPPSLVQSYVNNSWWNGFFSGWVGGICYTSVLFFYISYCKK